MTSLLLNSSLEAKSIAITSVH